LEAVGRDYSDYSHSWTFDICHPFYSLTINDYQPLFRVRRHKILYKLKLDSTTNLNMIQHYEKQII